MRIAIDGCEYDIAYSFSENRALIEYDGLHVFADRALNGVWGLSGEPARDGEEKEILKTFIAAIEDSTIITVTPPKSD